MPTPYRPKFLDIGSNLPNRVIIEGKFTIGGAGAVSAVTPDGRALGASLAADLSPVLGLLFTVTRTAAGVYEIAPSEQYLKIARVAVTRHSAVALGAADTQSVRTPAYDSALNKQVVYNITTADGLAAVPPAGTEFSFELHFINSVSPRT